MHSSDTNDTCTAICTCSHCISQGALYLVYELLYPDFHQQLHLLNACGAHLVESLEPLKRRQCRVHFGQELCFDVQGPLAQWRFRDFCINQLQPLQLQLPEYRNLALKWASLLMGVSHGDKSVLITLNQDSEYQV